MSYFTTWGTGARVHRETLGLLMFLGIILGGGSMAEESPESGGAKPSSWEERASDSAWQRVQELLSRPGTAWPAASPVERGEQTTAQPQGTPVARALALSGDVRQRMRAVELWSVSASHESVSGLLAALGDPDDGVRRASARALSDIESPELLNRVLEILANPASAEAQAVIQVLPELRPQLEAPMTDLLDRESAPQVQRWTAAYCVGRMGCVGTAPELLQLTFSDDTVLARTAAQALASLRSPETARDWFGLAQHPDPEVRRMAIEAIGMVGGLEAVDFLRSTAYGATEQDYFLQSVAVQQIAGLPRETSVPILIDIMKNCVQMRSEATGWLRSITGVDLPENPDEWDRWYKFATGQIRPPLVAAEEELPPPPPPGEDKVFPKVPPEWSGQVSPIEVGQWKESP